MRLATDQSQSPNATRTPNEKAYLHAVEFSDVATVRRLLAENPNLRVNVIDALGRTALRLAVRNENREIVEMLLQRCNSQNIHEAVLQAISEDHTAIAEFILKHPCCMEINRKVKRLGDTDGFFKTEVESQFSTDMTALNLAAQKNNFAIVQLLLQRGETIQKPHKVTCGCQECRNRMKFDQLRVAKFRLNAYRGLASEAYISLAAEDPFLSAFQLAKEIRVLSNDEKHFKKEYKDLARSLSRYVVKLLDRVWTQQELETVLNKKGPPDIEKYEKLARVKLALENKEKQFVAHPSVQQHLVEIWHHGLGKIDAVGRWMKYLCLATYALVYPFLVVLYFFLPNKKWAKLAKRPMVKFMGHTLSSVVFLMIIVICSFWGSDHLVSNKVTLKSEYKDIADKYQKYRYREMDRPTINRIRKRHRLS